MRQSGMKADPAMTRFNPNGQTLRMPVAQRQDTTPIKKEKKTPYKLAYRDKLNQTIVKKSGNRLILDSKPYYRINPMLER